MQREVIDTNTWVSGLVWTGELAAQADLIVSGDQDLLVLKAFEGIPILTAVQALEWLHNAAS
jgi:predicted nucleic acid-binding protein